MGGQVSSEFRGERSHREYLQQLLETKDNRDRIEAKLKADKTLREAVVDIIGSEAKVKSVFEESPEDSFKTLLMAVEEDAGTIDKLAQLLEDGASA